MFLEVIGLEARDVELAAQAGASRIELVSAMDRDGLSPDILTIRECLAVATIPVRIMVRFHNDGFVYDSREIGLMQRFIESVETMNIDGYVIGGLTADGFVDEELIESILKVTAKPLTFHRAIDYSKNQVEAVRVLEAYPQIDCILTSGGISKPIGENIATLLAMQEQSSKRLLAGGGVSREVFANLKKSGITSIHIGSLARIHGKIDEDISITAIEELLSV
ncbi:copper homeostasis protein CutC [Culicoidibacter larvae]|uniref:Copper homeostasis protein cutC homolog n=1 Tax=Culicoidibacter larvae TaxID=2579976 RepID=A0A5R8QH07_9FIRM|nr:copper homeostasis protein CutC [Culicoidibacter larvae]TLG77321.1 copper homeostasis protein CutC [Culicoidibacter larvae]